jgi:hypothetical protein
MKPEPATPWMETQARVTGCKYLFSRMNTLSLGVAADRNQFLISFTYYAHAKTYSGQFTAPTYLEQDSLFPISYNPLNPQENSKSVSPSAAGRVPLLAIGVAGSVILSLIYLAFLHGCN